MSAEASHEIYPAMRKDSDACRKIAENVLAQLSKANSRTADRS